MSGHSKWATIHRQKEANDAKRGAAFTKIANIITIAVKESGGIGDPEKNFKLRLAIEKAREVNMPKDNINRAIERASGAGANDLTEGMYEGFLPAGAGVLVQTLSDNKLRSAQQVREVLDKNGGSIANSGAVSYLFHQKGEITIAKPSNKPADEAQLELIDLGINDIEEGDGEWYLYCDKELLAEVRRGLEGAGYTVKGSELSMVPTLPIEVADETVKAKIESILEKLDDLDDVSKVWTNYKPV